MVCCGGVGVWLVKSESILGQGSGDWLLVASFWLLGGFWVLGLGCGVASLWVLGSGFWLLGDMCLMLEIDSCVSVFVGTTNEEESFWVSAFAKAMVDDAASCVPGTGF